VEARLRPIDRGVTDALGLPRFELAPGDLQKITRGRPLAPILDGAKPVFPGGAPLPFEAAALFCGGTFAGIAARKPGRDGGTVWGYGCVYAG
jgi:hypothetical protein